MSASRAGLEHDVEYVESFDGTRIAVCRMGAGAGMPVLLVNAIGANLAIWRRAVADLARERHLVAWDHRGLHSSEPPVSPRLDPGAHAEDAIAALEHHGVDRVAVVSWSNGSRIALELATRYPERVAALAIVNGGYGHPPGRLLRLEIASALPLVASAAKYFSGPLEGAFRRLVSRPEIAGLVRQSGMVGATADTAALVDLLRGMAGCDLETLLESFQEVAGDSGEDLLGQVEAPTLLVAGERDQFTSAAMTDQMARGIADSRVVTYEGATHYLPIEFPARLSDDLRKFLSNAGV